MALKNLVAQKAALTEGAIEDVVADYVRYDTDEMEIVFTPEFANLGNKAKVLVYLVALQGWPFVAEDAIATSAKPAEMEEALAIPGGTLRPILKDLKDRHHITVKGGAYSVRASHLGSVKTEIEGARKAPSKRAAKGKKATSAKAPKAAKKSTTGGGKKNQGLGDRFSQMIAEGFFDDGKTAAEVRDKFHEETVIIATSGLSPYFIKAVQDKKLTRTKEDRDGRKVWVYTTRK